MPVSFLHSKNLFIGLLLAFTCLCSCAQQQKLINNQLVFFTERLPGNIPVLPENSDPVVKRDTIITIYLETNSKLLKWDTAWRNGQAWHVTATEITVFPFEAGVRKADNEKVILQKTAGRFLWRLDLLPGEGLNPSYNDNGKSQFLLQGRLNGKTVYQELNQPVELMGLPTY